MKLTEEPEIVNWPETHYVFVEKVGPFMTAAPQAWQELHKVTAEIAEHNQIIGHLSLYKVGPKIYRAGVAVAAAPRSLPEGLRYEKFKGGKYSRFVMTGSYANLAEASGRTAELVAQKKVPLRDDYNIEHYVNDPRNTPEDELVTEILYPTV